MFARIHYNSLVNATARCLSAAISPAATLLSSIPNRADACAHHSSRTKSFFIKNRTALLREGIEQLSPECREVMILKVVYRHSHHDIAKEMGISTQMVESHIACAVRETHIYLQRHLIGAIHAG